MQTLTVVKNFDVFKYCNSGFVASFEIALMNQFNFQGVKKLSATALSQQSPFLLMLA
jgi:hypothetical protein